MLKKLPIFAIALVTLSLLTVGLGVASAQDVFKINYFANANVTGAPDATVRIDNPHVTFGHMCAMIYVFDYDQQLSECCGCLNSSDGLRTLSVNGDLTSNPLTGVKSTNGVIKVVSSPKNNSTSLCDPTSNVTPTPNLRVWATHIQKVNYATGGLGYVITETESSDATLGATELANLQAECAFIGILGSGHGVCSCGWGD
jgi:hypothetical protein